MAKERGDRSVQIRESSRERQSTGSWSGRGLCEARGAFGLKQREMKGTDRLGNAIAQVSGHAAPCTMTGMCKVTQVILHGVVSPKTSCLAVNVCPRASCLVPVRNTEAKREANRERGGEDATGSAKNNRNVRRSGTGTGL